MMFSPSVEREWLRILDICTASPCISGFTYYGIHSSLPILLGPLSVYRVYSFFPLRCVTGWERHQADSRAQSVVYRCMVMLVPSTSDCWFYIGISWMWVTLGNLVGYENLEAIHWRTFFQAGGIATRTLTHTHSHTFELRLCPTS